MGHYVCAAKKKQCIKRQVAKALDYSLFYAKIFFYLNSINGKSYLASMTYKTEVFF